ncbi:hypothetical protein [Fodinicola feengrottensis]|uniref:Actin-binding WH2 domain-containing protein n=1 Tax=Fodinicola feengrottensis TaxID=435914 RepID=A0ABN2HSD3_9ACTN|nr:hypothetical protein [Fodinicola feengrottensis]
MRRTLRDLLVIERILRDRDSVWRQIHEERDLRLLIGQLLASTVIALACYGGVLGASSSMAQAVSSALKLPVLFLVTLAICLPTLYLFNLVFGARLSLLQTLSLVLLAITVTSVLSLTFAPVSLFFLVTAPQYAFFKLLNVCVLTLTALVGLRFLVAGMTALNRLSRPPSVTPPAPPQLPQVPMPALSVRAMVGVDDEAWIAVPAPAQEPWPPRLADTGVDRVQPHQPPASRPMSVRTQEKLASPALLYLWILLFGFVGTQLGWALRPFFGSPELPFQLLRAVGGTFYADIVQTIRQLF